MQIKSTVVRHSVWVIVLTLLIGAVALAAPRLAPARAVALSPGCQFWATAPTLYIRPSYIHRDDYYAGETVSASVSFPATSPLFWLTIDFNIVDTTSIPGSVSYTFPADGNYEVEFHAPGPAEATVDPDCQAPGGSGGTGSSHETPPFQPAVQPYDGDDAEAIAAIPAPDGRLACGLFDLASTVPHTGWGFKTAYLPGWPDCPPDAHDVDILCLNEEGVWVTPAFTDYEVREDGLEITWFSHQDGVCGFFPK